jgi:hypothetical protein
MKDKENAESPMSAIELPTSGSGLNRASVKPAQTVLNPSKRLSNMSIPQQIKVHRQGK